MASIPVTDGFHAIVCALGGGDGGDVFLVANMTETSDDLWNGKASSRVSKTSIEVPAVPERSTAAYTCEPTIPSIKIIGNGVLTA